MGTERYMVLNGELTPWQEMEGAYVYQHIHTLNYTPYMLPQHIKIIDQAASALFELQFAYDEQDVLRQITTLLSAARLSRKVSICVTIKQYASEDVTIEYHTPSIYSGYVIRSLRPEATCLRMQIPLDCYPTSAAVAAFDMVDAIAQGRGYHTAVVIDDDDTLLSNPTQPVAIVRETTLVISKSAAPSVERYTLEQAARKAGYEVEYRPLKRSDLSSADEVLTMNWQGITAIQQINGKPYMAIIAENIAKELGK